MKFSASFTALALVAAHLSNALPTSAGADVQDIEVEASSNTTLLYEDLDKRATACDPIGCYDAGYFSIILTEGGSLTLYGANQSPQKHDIGCGEWLGFNSWLPYVFSTNRKPTPFCLSGTKDLHITYASINTQAGSDSRCDKTRCIFPIRP